MIQIYHNPQCSKSREGLQILEESGVAFQTILYLKEGISLEELNSIISKLNIKPIELVRKNEAIWKENFSSKTMTDQEILQAMVDNPRLIERPIVVNNQKAVVGRPPEQIKEII